MHPIISQSPHHQDCLTKLNRVLDLALITAESASAEGNHKVVIQAAREVTRIVTLINKMTLPPIQSRNPNQKLPLFLRPALPGGKAKRLPPSKTRGPPPYQRRLAPTGPPSNPNRLPGMNPRRSLYPTSRPYFRRIKWLQWMS